MNLAISPLLTLLATDATINPHNKYREQIDNNKIKQQQNKTATKWLLNERAFSQSMTVKYFCNFVYLQKPIKYITMKRLVILFALFFTGISAFAYGEESIGQKTNTEAGRYEIIIPDNMIRYTFRLDKFTGDIWQLVKNSDDSSTWQKVYRESSYFDSTDEDKINYQLIVPANAARFIMLININNGTTWQICRTKDDEVAFQLVY